MYCDFLEASSGPHQAIFQESPGWNWKLLDYLMVATTLPVSYHPDSYLYKLVAITTNFILVAIRVGVGATKVVAGREGVGVVTAM